MSTVSNCRSRLLTALTCSATGLMIAVCQPVAAQPDATQSKTVVGVKSKVLSSTQVTLLAKQLEWHRALLNVPVPHEGCFKAEYPHYAWQEVSCIRPPNIPMPPKHGALSDTVGNGYDYSASVSGQLISVVGSFDTMSTTGESGFTYQSQSTAVSDAYTLQVNSNFFPNPPACAGAATPATCQGWQQFVYSSRSSGSAFMQYWLINYGSACPAGWTGYGSDCYRNSAMAIAVPVIPATSLGQSTLTGSVAAGGDDRLDLAAGLTHYIVTSPDNIVQLANFWNTAEFTVVGDCCGFSANFNPNTSIAVRATVHNGTTSAPTCVLEGFTGETNNLNLVSTPAIGTQLAPTLTSDQTSASAAPASCAVASGIGDTHLHTFTPTPVANNPVSSLAYDFQAEGEFVLAKTESGFEVQTRQISGAPTWPNAALNQAIGVKIGNAVLVFSNANNSPQLLINGSPVVLANGSKQVLGSDGDVAHRGNTYVARDMQGNSVQVVMQSAATNYIDVYVGLGRWPTNVQGLLVTAKDNLNAVVTRTGTIFPAPFNFSTFYGVYGESWRVPTNQSLFTLAANHLPVLKVSNPTQPFDASHLPKPAYLAAKSSCQRAGVKAGALDDCILDVAVIGDKNAALSHVHPVITLAAKHATIFATEDVLPLHLSTLDK